MNEQDAGALLRALGRLEGKQDLILQNQTDTRKELKQEITTIREEMKAGDETNSSRINALERKMIYFAGAAAAASAILFKVLDKTLITKLLS